MMRGLDLGPVRWLILAAALALGVQVPACDAPTRHETYNAPDPIKDDVPPVRNTLIKVIVTSTLTYTAKDEPAVRENLPEVVISRLSQAGRGDGNTFKIASGEAQNLTLHYTINNDGNNRFTGSVGVGAWAGYSWTIHSGQYSYGSGQEMIEALTDKVYAYLHTGWHDPRKDK